ncbi:MAG: GGDEF domain-containing protein [bacterium]|nr:GGDEF domain-containing protein [bacterium]
MALKAVARGPVSWLLDRTWATVLVAVVASAIITVVLPFALTGAPPGFAGLAISTIASSSLSGIATRQRNRYLAALHGAHAELQARVVQVEALRDELRELALRDPLTGVFNRRVLDQVAPPMFARAARDGVGVALALFDVDDFKSVNDRHGHLVGDDVLVSLARHLTSELRATDLVCRYGGEEFAVLLPSVGPAGALARVDALRRSWVALGADGSLRPTLSAGIAVAPLHADDLDGMMAAADGALYRAKGAGRDRVEMAERPS